MARRTNYIEYFLPQVTASVAAATVQAFDPIWVAVPETGSRNWESVWLQFTARDNATSAASLSTLRIALSTSNGSGSHSPAPQYQFGATIANTDEHQSFAFSADYTSFFQTAFPTGTSIVQLFVSGVIVGIATSNWTAKLCMSYTYDDTVQTQRIKTVKIPMDSVNQAYRSTMWEISGTGSWAVPELHTFCKEGSKIWRDIAFEFFGNETPNFTTNFTTRLKLDETPHEDDATHTQNLTSGTWYYRVWKKLGVLNPVNPHRIFIGSSTTSRWNCAGGVLNVTYEYNTQTTSQSLNSVWMPFPCFGGSAGTYGSYVASVPRYNDFTQRTLKFWVEEPAPVLVNSGVVLHWWDQTAISRPAVAVNNALTRSLDGNISTAGQILCGGQSVVHRFDSGSYSGSMSLARGENTINLKAFVFDSVQGTPGSGLGFSALALVNYHSNVASGGLATHNHTIVQNWLQMVNTVPSYVRDFRGFAVSESRYWVNNVGFEVMGCYPTFTQSIALDILPSAPDGVSGWRPVGVIDIGGSNEIGLVPSALDATHLYRTHPQDQSLNGFPKRMWVTSSKQFALDFSDAATPWGYFGWGNTYLTYHSIVAMISGSVVNWDTQTSNGSGIGVEVYRARTHDLCLSMSTAVGGTFAESWYDDAEEYYCVAIPNSRSMGRSRAATPS